MDVDLLQDEARPAPAGTAPASPAPASPAPAAARYSRGGLVVSLLLSLAVIAVVGVVTWEPGAFRQIPQHLDAGLLAAALGTVVLRVLFGGWRLDYFSDGQLGLWGGMRSQVAWDFFAYITPSTIGGGPFAMAFIARDRGLPLGDATSIILFSMLLDQIWFALTVPALLLAAAFVEVIPEAAGAVGFWSFVLFVLGFTGWVALFAYGTLLRPQLLERALDRLLRVRWLSRFRERAERFMRDLQHRSALLRAQPARFYVKGFALTTVPWLCRYLLVLFLIWSVHPGLDRLLVFLRSVALHLSSIALPTPGGAGGLEGLYALFLGPLVPEPLVAPTLLAWRTLGFYVFIGLGALLMMGKVHDAVRRGARPAAVTESSRA